MQNSKKRKVLYISLGAALIAFSILPWLALITDNLAFSHVHMMQMVVFWRSTFQGFLNSGFGDVVGRVGGALFFTLIASAIMVAVGVLLVIRAFRKDFLEKSAFWIIITATLVITYLTSAIIYLATIHAGFRAYGHIFLCFLNITLLAGVLLLTIVPKLASSKKQKLETFLQAE
ncbi:MAG: hypothetical protein FWC11_02180 [Firmicutes bacterium]|nr:hypothetical protein [Bacillota bacterium]